MELLSDLNISKENFLVAYPDKIHISAITALEACGALPLTPESEVFPVINLINGAAFFHGTMPGGGGKIVPGAISASDPHQKEMIYKMLDSIGMRRKDRKQDKIAITYSRTLRWLITLMGMPTGKKSEKGVALPEYIQAAMNSLKSEDVVGFDQQIAHDTLENFFLSLLYYRRQIAYSANRKLLNLHAFRNKDHADRQAEMIREGVGMVFKDLRPKATKSAFNKNTKNYTGRITINPFDEKDNRKKYEERVKQAA